MEEARTAVFPHVSFKRFFKSYRGGKKEASNYTLLLCKANPKRKIPGKGSRPCLFTKTELICLQRLNKYLKTPKNKKKIVQVNATN